MSTVSSATRSGSSSEKEEEVAQAAGQRRVAALMRWALVTTPLCRAWRNTWVRRTRGSTEAALPPAWSRSRRTSPGPTLGSWSTSPTSSRWAPEDRLDQLVGQQQVEHGGLVDHHQVGLQRAVLVEGGLHEAQLEQPVQGLGVHPGQLRQALGGAPTVGAASTTGPSWPGRGRTTAGW